jgi:hypothetical protein
VTPGDPLMTQWVRLCDPLMTQWMRMCDSFNDTTG